MSGALVSDPLENLHGESDSVLTAARLARRGWTQAGKKTQWQLSQPPEGNQGPAGAERSGKKTAEDNKTEQKTDEGKQENGGAFLVVRQAGRQLSVVRSRAGVVCVWSSGCRTRSRQSRRSKAPILPAIAEI